MAIPNCTKTKRSYYDVLNSMHFQMGYTDYRLGIPLEYDRYQKCLEQSRYERGRVFAALCPLKDEVLYVNEKAVQLLERAIQLKEIV
jgi:hypothetical protein